MNKETHRRDTPQAIGGVTTRLDVSGLMAVGRKHLDRLGFAGLAVTCLMECNEFLTQSEARFAALSINKTTDSGLRSSALFPYLGLCQVATILNFSDKDFPIHGVSITQLRCSKAFLRYLFRLGSENAY